MFNQRADLTWGDRFETLDHVADQIKRWMNPDGTIRILVARSDQMVATAARVAGAGPDVAEIYGRLLTGTALLQLAQAPIYRVQVAIDQPGSAGQLLADVWPGPTVRGRIAHPQATGPTPVSDEGTLLVSRELAGGGGLYQSVVPMHEGRVSDALQRYMLESEQVLSVFALSTVVGEDGEVARAGGLLVQALPGMLHEHLEAVTLCLEKVRFEDLVQAGDDPLDAADSIFAFLGLHHLGDDPLRYSCRCSHERAVGAVLLLGDEVLAEVRAGGTEKVTCEFCGTTYIVGRGDLES